MTCETPVVDMTRLYRRAALQTSSIAHSQEMLRHALAEHEVRSGSGGVNTTMHSADARRLKMMLLRYGPEVEIESKAFDGFAVVQMPLHGAAEIVSDGRRIVVEKGQAAIVAPQRSLKVRWSRDCVQLLLRIPIELMQEAAQSSGNWWPQPPGSALLAPATVFDTQATARWAGLVQAFTELALPDSGPLPGAGLPSWLDHVEFSLALFLLTQQGHAPDPHFGESEVKGIVMGDAVPPLEPALAAAERYALTRLCAPISLEDLARAAGVSARSLHIYSRRRFGVGPMVWLRNMRLDAARHKLNTDSECRVTEAAMDFGFGHLGRFSAYYRERFGELPRDTTAARR